MTAQDTEALERYAVATAIGDSRSPYGTMVQIKNGDWVRFSDVQAALAKAEKSERDLSDLRAKTEESERVLGTTFVDIVARIRESRERAEAAERALADLRAKLAEAMADADKWREQFNDLHLAARGVLGAIEHEASAQLTVENALANFSNPAAEVDAAGKAMLLASEKLRHLEMVVGSYWLRGKECVGQRPGNAARGTGNERTGG